MNRAKTLGRDRCELFASDQRERPNRLLQLETQLRRARDRDELSVVYQPIVSLVDRHTTGFEALMRWQHPELGAIPPSEFILVAEETGLIIPLGEWVLREACALTRRWQEESPQHGALSVAVNVSARQLLETRFIERVREVLSQTGLGAGDLHLEITESMLMKEPERAKIALRELRALGVQLHMDDFGTGYSSLAYLHQFPIDTLKIDRGFVSNDQGDGIASPWIVETVMALARHLGLEVIAEGIETEEQESQLRSLGCANAQGYHFAAAMDPDTASRYLAAHHINRATNAPSS